MKSKAKGKLRFGTKLGLPEVFFFCLFFFFAGFFGSGLLPQKISSSVPRRWIREERDYDSVAHEVTGEDSVISIPFQVVSWRPRALYFPNFATSEQCQSIINMAKSNLTPSTVALGIGEKREYTEGIRTRRNGDIGSGRAKNRKVNIKHVLPHGSPHMYSPYLLEDAQTVMKPPVNQSSYIMAFHVLRYEIGQKYYSHYDTLDPAVYGPQKSHRIATFLVYLSDVEEGGETAFPFENGLNMDVDFDLKRCIGLKVKPRKGDGFLFYSMFPNGTSDLFVGVIDICKDASTMTLTET